MTMHCYISDNVGDCKDSNEYATSCPGWASNGECSGEHAAFMLEKCKKSCNACK